MNWKYDWQPIKEYKEIKFDFYKGIAKISINRPEKHNAFTPLTVEEMIDAMNICRDKPEIEIIILTGEGGKAFC
ncbi:MAG: enoyl-CoA hydratase-related protein, partial [Bacteroidia bacterium]